MLKKISLWDLFVTFGLGLLFFVSITIHLILTETINLNLFEKIPNYTTTILFLFFPLIFVIGLIVDGIEKILFDKIYNNKYYKLSKNPEDINKMSKYVKEKKIPEKLKEYINPYYWCKDYIIQNEIETPFMVFLSKYGFYRGTAFIFFLNSLSILIIYEFSFKILLISILLFILGISLIFRAKNFYQHTGRTIFRNYLIHENNKET